MDECSTRTNVSDYVEKLDPPTRKQYKEKSKVIGGVDPYCIEGDMQIPQKLPIQILLTLTW